ncbi:hypothetical protein DW228_05915 [Bacteroides fragilis]|uniref:Uncharacterized protein n=1 Tax=Bacteroides fragilis TaxID=817 RepID=A0A396C6I6_BACFG|nr:hypothetical protein [Bacteroides fragilis]RHH14332.1 hypothetical protein DW228_05915 [Bacteroides fragilis]
MKRYSLPTDRLVNQLVPHFLGGRKYILFIQSLVYPLQRLNEYFKNFAGEKHIEARMTSQVLYFEWFLNYKFGKYLVDKQEKIIIQESISIGVDIYHEDSHFGRPFTIWYNLEEIASYTPDEEHPKEFYYLSEEKAINKVSFMVVVPQISIDRKEFVYMLSYVINTYRTAGKTYLIKIEDQKITPNKPT